MMNAACCTMRRSISQPPADLFEKPTDMFWLLFEAGVALALLLFIVWWTWPRAPRDKGDRPGP